MELNIGKKELQFLKEVLETLQSVDAALQARGYRGYQEQAAKIKKYVPILEKLIADAEAALTAVEEQVGFWKKLFGGWF